MPELELTWGLVVESDEVFSPKANKWYRVNQVAANTDGTKTKVWAEGVAKAWVVPADGVVTVRRGETGKVVDLFRIIFSGPMTREQ